MMADNKSKTVWVTLHDVTLYYPKLFDFNRDTGDMHNDTQGVTKVTIALTEAQEKELLGLGVPVASLGYQTFKDMTVDGVNFRGFTVKRPWYSKYIKEDDGSFKFVGAPKVFDYNEAVEAWKAAGAQGRITDSQKTSWDVDSKGLIGNGSKAKVKLTVYRGTNKAGKATCVVQLEEVAITELVPYDAPARDESEIYF
jgi:hypothetical protein